MTVTTIAPVTLASYRPYSELETNINALLAAQTAYEDLRVVSGSPRARRLAQTPELVAAVYEGLLMRAQILMDDFAKEHLLASATGVTPATFGHPGPISSPGPLEDIFYLDRKTFDWVSMYTNFRPRLDAIFPSGHVNPFWRLFSRETATRTLRQMKIVRDHVAHGGEQARTRYEQEVLTPTAPYMRPGLWLTQASTGSAGAAPVTNFARLAGGIRDMAQALSQSSVTLTELDQLLGPTAMTLGKKQGEDAPKGPPGDYRCAFCSTQVYRLPRFGFLPESCSNTLCPTAPGSSTVAAWRYEAK